MKHKPQGGDVQIYDEKVTLPSFFFCHNDFNDFNGFNYFNHFNYFKDINDDEIFRLSGKRTAGWGVGKTFSTGREAEMSR